MAREISLTVNNNPIKLDFFVEGYIYHVTSGIIASLKDTDAIRTLELIVDESGDIKIELNGKDIPLNFFATEIIRNTFAGMVQNLKGVDGKLKTLELRINR